MAQEKVGANGGKYSPKLSLEVTHLLAMETTGPKYDYAVQHNIRVVHPSWVDDCIGCGGRIDPTDPKYCVAPTQAPKARSARHVDEGKTVSDVEKAIVIQHDEDNEYLDACKIFLSGLRSERLKLMVKIIRAAGGFKLQELDESVTHVVIGGAATLAASDVARCQQLRNEPKIVSDKWLVECCKAKRQIDTGPFVDESLKPPEPEVPKPAVNKPRRRESSFAKPKKPAKTEPAVTDQDLDFTNMFDQSWDKVAAPQPVPDPAAEPTAPAAPTTTVSAGVGAPGPALAKGKAAQSALAKGKAAQSSSKGENAGGGEADDTWSQHESDYNGYPSQTAGGPMAVDEEDMTADELARRNRRRGKLFHGLKFAFINIPLSTIDSLRKVSIAHGGQCVVVEGEANCIVVPMTSGYISPHGTQVLTTCWWEWCTASVKLYNSDCFLFRPFEIPDTLACFKDIVICMSGFEDPAKTHIHELCQKIGAKVTSQFNKKINTHLICRVPLENFAKHKKATKWKIPAVTLEWLFDSVRTGSLEQPANYAAQRDQQPSKSPYMETTPSRLVQVESPASSKRRLENITNGIGARTPTLNTNKKFRPSFDTNDITDALKTPHGSRQGHSTAQTGSPSSLADGSNPDLAAMFGQNLKQANTRTSKRCASEILRGVAVYVASAKALQGRREELHQAAKEIGATVAPSVDACTHFVCKGRTSSKEFKEAESKKRLIVAADWLFECRREGTRLVEQNFPHSYDPKRSLGGVSASRGPSPLARCASSSERKVGTPSARSHAQLQSREAGQDQPAVTTTPLSSAKSPNTAENEQTENLKDAVFAFMKKHKNKEGDKPGYRRKIPQNVRGEDSKEAGVEGDLSLPDACSISAMECGERKKSVTYLGKTSLISMDGDKERAAINGEDDAHQSGTSSNAFGSHGGVEQDYEDDCSQAAVTYDDPDRDERQKMIELLQSGRSSVPTPTPTPTPGSDSSMQQAAEPQQAQRSPKRARTSGSNYQILLSALNKSEKTQLTTMIKDLEGTSLDSATWDSKCTHLIAGNPNRSEKYLAACASGVWVLHPSFVTASQQAGYFVNEEDHEYGGSEMKGVDENHLTMAPHRWRIKIQKTSRAFHNWRVLLCVGQEKQAGFGRLLEAGGATVLALSPPFPADHDATHALVDVKAVKDNALDVHKLKTRDCLCVKSDYISVYLADAVLPDKEDFLLPDVARPPGSDVVGSKARRRSKNA